MSKDKSREQCPQLGVNRFASRCKEESGLDIIVHNSVRIGMVEVSMCDRYRAGVSSEWRQPRGIERTGANPCESAEYLHVSVPRIQLVRRKTITQARASLDDSSLLFR